MNWISILWTLGFLIVLPVLIIFTITLWVIVFQLFKALFIKNKNKGECFNPFLSKNKNKDEIIKF